MFCTVSLTYFLEQAAKMPSFRNPVPAIAASEHPLSSSAAAASGQSLNFHGATGSTFNVYNYNLSSVGSKVPALNMTSAYLRPAQSLSLPLSRPSMAYSSSALPAKASQLSTVAETGEDTETESGDES